MRCSFALVMLIKYCSSSQCAALSIPWLCYVRSLKVQTKIRKESEQRQYAKVAICVPLTEIKVWHKCFTEVQTINSVFFSVHESQGACDFCHGNECNRYAATWPKQSSERESEELCVA